MNTDLNTSRYFRLMALATVEILGTVPISIWIIYVNLTKFPLKPYISFANTHSNFGRVIQYPAILWMNWPITRDLLRLRWAVVACGFIFFAFFGFADEARKHYRHAFNSFAKRVGFSTGSMGSSGQMSSGTEKPHSHMSTQGVANHPSFVRPVPAYKRESVHSNTSSFKTIGRQDSHHSFANPLTGHVTIADVVKIKKDGIMSSSSAKSSTVSLPRTPPDALRSSSLEHASSEDSHDDKYASSLSNGHTLVTPRPEVALDVKSPPRHVADAPMSAGTDDIV